MNPPEVNPRCVRFGSDSETNDDPWESTCSNARSGDFRGGRDYDVAPTRGQGKLPERRGLHVSLTP